MSLLTWENLPGANDMGPYATFYRGACLTIKPSVVVELGVRAGVSARILLEVLPRDTLVHLVDPVISEQAAWLGEDRRVRLYQAMGEDVAKQFNAIDLLHIDTDPHSYEQTKELVGLYAPKISERGAILFHDAAPGWGVYSFLVDELRTWPGWQLTFCPIAAGSENTAPAMARRTP